MRRIQIFVGLVCLAIGAATLDLGIRTAVRGEGLLQVAASALLIVVGAFMVSTSVLGR